MSLPALALLVLALLGARVPAAAAPKAPKPLALRPIAFEDPAPMPLAVRHRVTDRLPKALAPSGPAAVVSKKGIAIDLKGTGKSLTRVRPSKSAQVRVVSGETTRTLLVFDLAGAWYAVPADGWASAGRTRFEVLDADLDGEPLTPGDYVRWSGEPFAPVGTWARTRYEEDPATMRAEAAGKGWRVAFTRLPPSKETSAAQWAALRSCNRLRMHAGLVPLLLDADRARGCQLHAHYLYENAYSYTSKWDGVGSHDELEGKAGYTVEGKKAARYAVTSPNPIPSEAIYNMFRTMMHRINFLSHPDTGLGVGAVNKSKTKGASGYSVIWAAKPTQGDEDGVIPLPAPGATDVPLQLKTERPRIEHIDRFYEGTRGFPVTVSWGRQGLTNARLHVFRVGRRGRLTELAGHVFTPESPRHHTRKRNSASAVFAPLAPLPAESTLLVRFEAMRPGSAAPVRHTWTFQTGKRAK